MFSGKHTCALEDGYNDITAQARVGPWGAVMSSSSTIVERYVTSDNIFEKIVTHETVRAVTTIYTSAAITAVSVYQLYKT